MGATMVAPAPSLTVGIFGGPPNLVKRFGSALGKKGTESDLLFWNKKERDVAVTALTAVAYPERIGPLLQVAALCDLPVLIASDLDAAFAETVLALEAFSKRGLLVLADPTTAERTRSLVKAHLPGWIALEGGQEESVRRFRDLVLNWDTSRDPAGPCTVAIDHAFPVRGDGTVALGFERRGTLRVHDELRLVPQGRIALVRSIQRFDEDQVEAPSGSRVGVALKGVEASEIDRGSVLTADEDIVPASIVRIDPFHRVDLAKDALEPGARGFHLLAGTFPRPAVLREIDQALEVEADRALPLVPKETACLLALRGPGTLRLLGHGPMAP